jgi:AraC-like DNA-binding protein
LSNSPADVLSNHKRLNKKMKLFLLFSSSMRIFVAEKRLNPHAMNPIYKKIVPAQVWISYQPREISEAEQWTGITTNEYGNRPCGNDFIDLFAGLIKQHGWHDAIFYARIMEIPPLAFSYTVQTLTGITAKEWIEELVLLAACELLLQTNMSLSEVATKLGFTQLGSFSNLFLKRKKMRPREWRWKNKG